MSTLSIYDAVEEVILELDAEIDRRTEIAFDAPTPYQAGVLFQYAYSLRSHLLNLVSAQEKSIDAIFSAVAGVNTFIECPF